MIAPPPAPEELAALKARIEKLEAQPAGVPLSTPCPTPQQSAS
jgi:BMFP domain-containing protein YqiC